MLTIIFSEMLTKTCFNLKVDHAFDIDFKPKLMSITVI